MSVQGLVKVTPTNPDTNAEGYVVRQVGIASAEAASDALTNPTTVKQLSHGIVWNGSTWERERGNLDGTALADQQRGAGTADSGDIVNYGHRGLHVYTKLSAVGASGVLNIRVQGKDSVSGDYYTLATGASLSGAGSVQLLKVYPGISAGAASINDVLPRTFRVTCVPTGSVTATYSVGYSLIK